MRLVILFMISNFLSSAFAGGGKHLSASVNYACLSMDGIPIPMDTALATQCCSNGKLMDSAPENCKNGFHSINTDSGHLIVNSLNLAKKTLEVANDLNGVVTDYSDKEQKKAEASAISAGAGANDFGQGRLGGVGSELENGMNESGSGAGSGAGSRGGGSEGSGLGQGFSDNPNGLNQNAQKSLAIQDPSAGSAALGFSRGGDSGRTQDGFGGMGGSGGQVGTDGAQGEVRFGDSNEANLGEKDSNFMTGNTNDAPDYLSRISKDASIFKIISKRITRENLRKHVGE
jgi:hypothetical protein